MSKSVCIYCASRNGLSQNIIAQSILMAEDLARMGFDLVYGGGTYGMMKIVADVFLSHGRKVTGIRPQKLIKDEDVHTGLTVSEEVEDMYVRRKRMIELSDYLVALPGGTGTLDEIMDAFSGIKLGYTDKWLGVLNVDGFYDPLRMQLGKMVENEFLRSSESDMIHFAESPRSLLGQIQKIEDDETVIDKLAYIHIHEGKILTTLSKGKDKYYIPGGKRDLGETDVQALMREVKEELSVDLVQSSIEYCGTYSAQAHGKPDGVQVRMTCYTGEYKGELKAANEIAEIRWMNYSDIGLVSHVDVLIFDDLKMKGIIS